MSNCPATMVLVAQNASGTGSVRLHCARTDEHTEHRAGFRRRVRMWRDEQAKA